MKIKKRTINKEYTLLALLFHIGLGIIAYINRSVMMLYFIGFVFYFTMRIIKAHKNRSYAVFTAVAYTAGIEVFLRMTKAYFLYESGKYLVIFFIVIGLFYEGFKKNAYPYVLFLLLLIPGIAVTYVEMNYELNFRKAILFNISGPLTLAVVSIYTYGKKLTFKSFLNVLDYIIYPLISMTVYIILYRPDLRDVIKNTSANATASGGYGPNQVATVLGLGAFILFSRLLIPYANKVVHFIMMFFLAAMVYRGFLTFSRGGMLTAAVMIAVFLILYFFITNIKTKVKTIFKLLAVGGVLVFIWTLTILQTGGLIENRYTNKDALGREKEDVTSGRVDISKTELDAFFNNPYLGVGVGQGKSYRYETTGIQAASHNEVTRMLSEHGLLGLIGLSILFFAPIINNPWGRKNIYFYPFLLFWLLTISHSAMRIAAPAVIYGLGLITITREKK